MVNAFPVVRGRCPACRRTDTLFVGAGGYVTCSGGDCVRPLAAHEWLSSADQDAVAKRSGERDRFMAEMLRQEHEALRWEHPHEPPEWTRRMREQLGISWVPGCCRTCSSSPSRYHRDHRRWPRLFGWTPTAEDEAEAEAITV